MAIYRKLINKYKPEGERGFLGAGHLARPVIQVGYRESDPFILLMDDMLDKKDSEPVGGPHPHAGFETVTLLIEGELGDGKHKMKDGDLQQMTAGSGIIHTETIEKKARLRLLQLWLALPKKDRWTAPRVQDLRLEAVPVSSIDGAQTRVYSGNFAGVQSPLLNYTKIIIADINIKPGGEFKQQLPAGFTTFMYVIDGDLKIGEDERLLTKDEVG
ncbi:MAG: pirin family protein, partial [Flavitalea sp.]